MDLSCYVGKFWAEGVPPPKQTQTNFEAQNTHTHTPYPTITDCIAFFLILCISVVFQWDTQLL